MADEFGDWMENVPDDLSHCKCNELNKYLSIIERLNEPHTPDYEKQVIEYIYPEIISNFKEIPDVLLSNKMKFKLAPYALEKNLKSVKNENKVNAILNSKEMVNYKSSLKYLLLMDIDRLSKVKISRSNLVYYYLAVKSAELLGEEETTVEVKKLIDSKLRSLTAELVDSLDFIKQASAASLGSEQAQPDLDTANLLIEDLTCMLS